MTTTWVHHVTDEQKQEHLRALSTADLATELTETISSNSMYAYYLRYEVARRLRLVVKMTEDLA